MLLWWNKTKNSIDWRGRASPLYIHCSNNFNQMRISFSPKRGWWLKSNHGFGFYSNALIGELQKRSKYHYTNIIESALVGKNQIYDKEWNIKSFVTDYIHSPTAHSSSQECPSLLPLSSWSICEGSSNSSGPSSAFTLFTSGGHILEN